MAQHFWKPKAEDVGNPPSDCVISQPWSAFTSLLVKLDEFDQPYLEINTAGADLARRIGLFSEIKGQSISPGQDFEVYLKMRTTPFSVKDMCCAAVRCSGGISGNTMGYLGILDHSSGNSGGTAYTLFFGRYLSGAYSNLLANTAPSEFLDEVMLHQTLKVVGTQLSGKLWLDGNTEPETSTAEFNNTSNPVTTAGLAGFASTYPVDTPWRLYEVGIGTGADPAPREELAVVGTVPSNSPVIDAGSSTATETSLTVAYTYDAGGNTGDPVEDFAYRVDGGAYTSFGDSATRQVTISGLSSGTTYSVEIAAKNSAGLGPWSTAQNLSTASTVTTAPSNAPTLGESITVLGNSAIIPFTFDEGANSGDAATSFEFRVGGGLPVAFGSGATTALNLSGLGYLTEYSVEIRAVNDGGTGPWSTSKGFTTDNQSFLLEYGMADAGGTPLSGLAGLTVAWYDAPTFSRRVGMDESGNVPILASNTSLVAGQQGQVVITDGQGNRAAARLTLPDPGVWYPTKANFAPSTPTVEAQASAMIVAVPPNGSLDFVPLFMRDIDEQREPASITKLMTCLVALDNISSMSDTIEMISGDETGGSGSNLQVGDVLTYSEAFYNLLLPSSNVTSTIVARTIGNLLTPGGGVSRFITEMNAKAAALGMSSTSFGNASGLRHVSTYTTARDMIRLGLECLRFPEIVSRWGQATHLLTVTGPNARSFTVACTHVMIANEEADILGGKTGTLLSPDTYNLLTYAQAPNDNKTLSVVLRASSTENRYAGTRAMIDAVNADYTWAVQS